MTTPSIGSGAAWERRPDRRRQSARVQRRQDHSIKRWLAILAGVTAFMLIAVVLVQPNSADASALRGLMSSSESLGSVANPAVEEKAARHSGITGTDKERLLALFGVASDSVGSDGEPSDNDHDGADGSPTTSVTQADAVDSSTSSRQPSEDAEHEADGSHRSTSTSRTTIGTNPARSPKRAPTTAPTAVRPVPVTGAPTTTRPPSTTAPKLGPVAGARPWEVVSNGAFRRAVDRANLQSVEYLTRHLAYGTLVGDGQAIHVLMLHRSPTSGMRVSPGNRSAAPVGVWAHEIGASAGVNANWYSPFDGPAVAQGVPYGGTDHGYTALFGFAADGRLISQHHRIENGFVDPRIREAVAGHPTLLHRGQITSDFGGDPTFTNRHPRTAIGATKSTDVVIIVAVDGRRPTALGMTGAETAALLRRLGAHDAVMLDGGGSSAMWIAGRGIVNQPSDPGRRVGNQIAVFGHR